MPVSKGRAIFLCALVSIELFAFIKLSSFSNILENYSPKFFFFNFKDVFLKIPFLALLLIFALKGKQALKLLPQKESTRSRFVFWLSQHSLMALIFYGLTHILMKEKDDFVIHFFAYGFSSILLAFIFLWMACFEVRIKEIKDIYKAVWKPVLASACFIFFNRLFIVSYESSGGLLSYLSWPLKASTFESVRWILEFLFDSVNYKYEDLVIGLSSFSVVLRYGCSGVQGMNLFLICSLMFYLIERNHLNISKMKISIFIISGAVLSYLGNIVRIVMLVVIGELGYEDWAVGSFHSYG
jgi:exosortase/archaeosortase family protein